MAKVKDPVCGMTIDSDTAAGKSTMGGETFYFCSKDCLRQFEANPGAYRKPAAPIAGKDNKLETHEPNFTKKGGMTAPKFGSAGSGGLEYERIPEAHDKG